MRSSSVKVKSENLPEVCADDGDVRRGVVPKPSKVPPQRDEADEYLNNLEKYLFTLGLVNSLVRFRSLLRRERNRKSSLKFNGKRKSKVENFADFAMPLRSGVGP